MGSSIKDEKALSPKVDLVQDSFSSSASAKGKELEAAVNPAVDYVDEDSPALHAAHAKVDKRLVLWYAFVYLIMRIHVGNITNTAIINLEEGTGIKKQLGDLTSQQWAWCISIFYYPYMFFEPASTMMLKKTSPSKWMSRIMLTWGIISMCQGATQNYAGLLACRFFLGMAEAGFYPGVLYHFSFWYSTKKMSMRLAFFYACGMFSGTVSGLLAYAISFMNGVGGLAGWRWVFILEGIPAILCAAYTFWRLPDYPETEKFLSEEEKQLIIAALPKDQPKSTDKTWEFSQVVTLIKDPTFVPFSLIWILHGIGGWGISFVLPTVIYEMGFTDTARSQLMTMPPYSAVFILLCTLGYCVRKGWANPWVVGLCLESVQVLCYILLLVVKNVYAKYIFILIATAAAQSIFPIIWPERIRAARGTTTAGMAIGITNGLTQLMGIVGPQIYQNKFGPTYKVSYGCSVGLLTGCTFCIALAWYLVNKDDARRAKLEEEDIASTVAPAQMPVPVGEKQ